MTTLHECDQQPKTEYLVQRPYIEFKNGAWYLIDCEYENGPNYWGIHFCPWCGITLEAR
jgi:hypothetical protein